MYPCPLSFWLTLPRIVLSTSWCCPSRPCVAFLACVHLALFLALSLSAGNSLVSSWCDHSMLASWLLICDWETQCSWEPQWTICYRTVAPRALLLPIPLDWVYWERHFLLMWTRRALWSGCCGERDRSVLQVFKSDRWRRRGTLAAYQQPWCQWCSYVF